MSTDFLSATDDEVWREDGRRHGWQLPKAAAWPLRLPIIRIFRYVYFEWKVTRWTRAWRSIGIGAGGPAGYDRWVLYAIARGWI